MNKTGIVLEIKKNTAMLMTNTGEFVKVSCTKSIPEIGETYTGTVKKEISYIKQFAAAAAMFIILLCSSAVYAYVTPAATVAVSINPALEIKVNRFDKVVKVIPQNKDGIKVLKILKLDNKDINEALIEVVEAAKKDNFINKAYNDDGKTISITVYAKNKTITLDKFKNYISSIKINTAINNNGNKSIEQFTKAKSQMDNKDESDNKQVKVNNNTSNDIYRNKNSESNNKENNSKESSNKDMGSSENIKTNAAYNSNSSNANNKNNIQNNNGSNEKIKSETESNNKVNQEKQTGIKNNEDNPSNAENKNDSNKKPKN